MKSAVQPSSIYSISSKTLPHICSALFNSSSKLFEALTENEMTKKRNKMNKLNPVDTTAEAVSITVSSNSTLIYVLNINWLDWIYICQFSPIQSGNRCACVCVLYFIEQEVKYADYTFVHVKLYRFQHRRWHYCSSSSTSGLYTSLFVLSNFIHHILLRTIWVRCLIFRLIHEDFANNICFCCCFFSFIYSILSFYSLVNNGLLGLGGVQFSNQSLCQTSMYPYLLRDSIFFRFLVALFGAQIDFWIDVQLCRIGKCGNQVLYCWSVSLKGKIEETVWLLYVCTPNKNIIWIGWLQSNMIAMLCDWLLFDVYHFVLTMVLLLCMLNSQKLEVHSRSMTISRWNHRVIRYVQPIKNCPETNLLTKSVLGKEKVIRH